MKGLRFHDDGTWELDLEGWRAAVIIYGLLLSPVVLVFLAIEAIWRFS